MSHGGGVGSRWCDPWWRSGGARQEAAFLCRPMFANGLPRHPMPSTQEGQHDVLSPADRGGGQDQIRILLMNIELSSFYPITYQLLPWQPEPDLVVDKNGFSRPECQTCWEISFHWKVSKQHMRRPFWRPGH